MTVCAPAPLFALAACIAGEERGLETRRPAQSDGHGPSARSRDAAGSCRGTLLPNGLSRGERASLADTKKTANPTHAHGQWRTILESEDTVSNESRPHGTSADGLPRGLQKRLRGAAEASSVVLALSVCRHIRISRSRLAAALPTGG